MKTAGASTVAEDAVPLVFQWERRSQAHWRLAALVALSFLVHAVGFYVLQVAYIPTGSQLPPPVQVMMARPERPDDPPEVRAQSRALAHWLAVTDPSLETQPAAPDGDRTPGNFARYVPSYKAAPPPFKPLDPPSAGTAAPPRPRPPGPVPILPASSSARPPGPSPLTCILLTGGIGPLVAGPLPPVAFALPAGAKTLSVTVFLVGVRPDGGAPFLFRETGSGEVSADEFAQDYLARLPFQPPPGPDAATVWGRAEFHWGREVYR